MTELLEKPIYISGDVPKDVSPKHLHQDFKMSSKYLLESGIMSDKTEYGYSYFEKYYYNQIITESELIKLVEFWNLGLVTPENYIGEIPYLNQVEIYDFFKTLEEKEIKQHSDPKKSLLIVSTKDLIYDKDYFLLEKKKIEDRIIKRNNQIFKIYEEMIMKHWLKNDPIVLYPINNFETNQNCVEKAYIIVTAWGDEAQMI
jgi:hypothetical protein